MKLGSLVEKRFIITGKKYSSVIEAVDAILDLFNKRGALPVPLSEVREKVLEREALGGTILPSEVAIPHVRVEGFHDLLVGVWVPPEPLETKEGSVRFLFFFLTSKAGSPNYLPVLATIARSCMEDNFPKNMENAGVNEVQEYLNSMVINKEVTVVDIMTPEPITCRKETTLSELADIFFQKKLSYLPVVDDQNRLIGEVTIKNLLSKGVPDYVKQLGNVRFLKTLEPFEALLRDEDKILVGEIMQQSKRGLDKDASIIEVVSVMISKGYRHIPILDGTQVIGLVSETDILQKVIRG